MSLLDGDATRIGASVVRVADVVRETDAGLAWRLTLVRGVATAAAGTAEPPSAAPVERRGWTCELVRAIEFSREAAADDNVEESAATVVALAACAAPPEAREWPWNLSSAPSLGSMTKVSAASAAASARRIDSASPLSNTRSSAGLHSPNEKMAVLRWSRSDTSAPSSSTTPNASSSVEPTRFTQNLGIGWRELARAYCIRARRRRVLSTGEKEGVR
jgi:hypothetical protein